jgi:2'-5' RNA ligase
MRRAVVDVLVQNKVWFDGESAFKPHVTLVRDAELPPDLVFTPMTWLANQIVLVQSITHPEGPEYRILASRNLEDASAAPTCDIDE